MENSWFKHRILIIYVLISINIFNSIYETSKSVVDELFHVKQGMNYCFGFYYEWDPKITTLPGLYLLTAFLPRCSLFTLRMIPFICSLINYYLIYGIRSAIMDSKNDQGRLKVLLDTATLVILPPMYFFSFIYYTDVPSITTILSMIFFSLKQKYFIASLFAFLSVLMRQTNIVWVAAILGTHLADDMLKSIYPQMDLKDSTMTNFFHTIKSHLKSPRMLVKFMFSSIVKYYGYTFVILAFIIFLIKNGSIVVGDKTAHEATVHLPQLLYFSVFTLVFGFSMWISNVLNFLKGLRRRNFLILVILTASLMAVIIRYNTIVHPYLLADNRHYTFYVWNRLYGRHAAVRYLLIPVYIFGMYVIFKSLNGSIGFKLFYCIATILTFCLQGLIEVRYFLVPFIVLRIFRRDVSKKCVAIEFLISLAINYVTLRNFHNIKVAWTDFDDPQRIIW